MVARPEMRGVARVGELVGALSRRGVDSRATLAKAWATTPTFLQVGVQQGARCQVSRVSRQDSELWGVPNRTGGPDTHTGIKQNHVLTVLPNVSRLTVLSNVHAMTVTALLVPVGRACQGLSRAVTVRRF